MHHLYEFVVGVNASYQKEIHHNTIHDYLAKGQTNDNWRVLCVVNAPVKGGGK